MQTCPAKDHPKTAAKEPRPDLGETKPGKPTLSILAHVAIQIPCEGHT